MDEPESLSPKNINKALESLKIARPIYSNLIDYFEQLLIVQDTVAETVSLSPINHTQGYFKSKVEKNIPLVSRSDFLFDEKATRKLMERICDLTQSTGLSSTAMAERFKTVITDDGFQFEKFIRDFLNQDENAMDHLASLNDLDSEFLFHVTYQGLKPSIHSFAKSVSVFLPPDFYWGKGVCPVCGGTPALATLDHKGKRFLHCGFCWHQWRVNRGFCPVCDNNDPETLHYFCSEEEIEYRVDLCEKCKIYIKCIDSRNAKRLIYPPIEQVVTIHLDMAAQRDGYLPSTDLLAPGYKS